MKTLPNKSIAYTQLSSPLGAMLAAATDNGLAGLWFVGQQHAPSTQQVAQWHPDDAHPLLQATGLQLASYFAGRSTTFTLELDVSGGTPFQRDVWRALQTIAPTRLASYGAIAAQIGRPTAVRAVGAAIGRNPISVIIPCHRVVGSTGSLTGYAGGLDRKRALLQLENAA
jgi:methylated-DNA-[protein]-cysteine S-methyltransferase